MSKIYPILLAGGSGTRLWPLSRKSYPKQFSKIIGETSLFQQSAKRLTSSHILEFTKHIIITNSNFRFIIGEQLQEVGINPGQILIEPQAKNTAAAILAASIFVHSRDKNAVLIAAPSDHIISDRKYFHEAINIGLSYVQKGKIVTFGIKPSHPEIGYGYIELSKDSLDIFGSSNVKTFIEKPDLKHAEYMLSAGNFLWNAGIFLFKAKDMIEAFNHFAPEILNIVSQSVDNLSIDLDFFRLAPEPWCRLNEISIDYAIMEKVNNLVAVPYNSKWSDLGGWDAVWLESKLDSSGNAISENSLAVECTNSLLRTEGSDQQLVGLGLNKIMAIAMPDAVLIADVERTQDVKKALGILKKKNITQAEFFPKDHRPWGWFENLVSGDRFKVKQIYVKPGAMLSLQSHNHRSEHWIVVEGKAKVTIDAKIKIVTEGQSVYVPLKTKHRLENIGTTTMIIIEVQIGRYLGEDDIIRYEDLYSRN